MADNHRELIVAAMKTAFGNVSVANGYKTEIGQKITVWQTDEVQIADMPCVVIADGSEQIEPLTMGSGNLGQDKYSLEVKLVGYAATDEGTTAEQAATLARKILEDLLKACGVDSSWGGAARWTKPTQSDIDVTGGNRNIAAAQLTISVEYATKRFDYQN